MITLRVSNNYLKKIIAILLIFISSFSIFANITTANAFETWDDSKMINGIGQSGNRARYYWYDTGTLSSTWRTRINNGMTAWSNTGSQGCGIYTSVWFKRTTTKSSSVIDFYNVDLGNGIFGMTNFYIGTGSNSTQIYPYNVGQNWVWAKISINEEYSDDSNLMTTAQKLAMVEHEIGHAFGLAHVESRNVIMYPHGNLCNATRPTVDDCEGIIHLYGVYNP